MNSILRNIRRCLRDRLLSRMALLQAMALASVALRAADPIPQFLSVVATEPDGVPPKECGANGRQQVVPAAQCLGEASFHITLPSGLVVTVVRDRWEDRAGGDGVWCGHVEGEPLSRVTIATRGGVLSAVVDRPFDQGNEVVELSPTAAGIYHWYQRDDATIPACLPPPPTPGNAGGPSASGPPSIAADPAADPVVIDIMVVYSTASRSRYGQAGIEAKILQAVSDANTAFANSSVNAQYNLVYLGEVAYTETGSMYTTLDALVSSTDGIRFRRTWCA